MPAKPDKKAVAEHSAREIYRKLMALPRPLDLTSNNDLTKAAGVSTSFFTNLKGKDGEEPKAPSNPTVSNLRLVLEKLGVTLPEFFLDEGQGRVVQVPTTQELEQALADVWEGLPRGKDRQIAFVAESVLRALALPETAGAKQDEGSTDQGAARAK